MKASVPLCHQFVESVPDRMEEGVVYVSIKYRSVIHLCVCGCKSEVVTPLSPTDWRLTFDGVSVSLDPSVGNWSLPCRSHYFIRRNKAVWAGDWSDERVAAGRDYDRKMKDHYFGGAEVKDGAAEVPPVVAAPVPEQSTSGLLSRAMEFLFGRSGGK